MQTQTVRVAEPHRQTRRHVGIRRLLPFVMVGVVLFLALHNLAGYPQTWFDEGSHLHVPKTLVRFGVYADYSSEGFRFFGPTIGIGPTVSLPIALAFKVAGIGLLQARAVMVIYLLGAVRTFFLLAKQLSGLKPAWVALLLLISSRSVALMEYGRQVLGEVPALFFLLLGLLLWYLGWETSGRLRLVMVGVLLGLAMVTKYQFLLFIAPALSAAWLGNVLYYRTAPSRVFVVPGMVAALVFALWQAYLVVYLGPATAAENLSILRETAAGAAAPFSRDMMMSSLGIVFGRVAFLGALIPVLVYGIFLAVPRSREGHQWLIVYMLMICNLGWYVVASVGWLRYAFLGMAVACLFVGRFFHDVTGGYQPGLRRALDAARSRQPVAAADAVACAMVVWLAVMVAAPLAKTTIQVIVSDNDAPLALAAYLNANVSMNAVLETWEPELGVLTDHNYHYPPASFLAKAVSYVHLGGPSPAQAYDYVQSHQPDYVIVGPFGRVTELYAGDLLNDEYRLVTSFAPYEVYRHVRLAQSHFVSFDATHRDVTHMRVEQEP